jgi:phosphatidylserine/phosphatidylglycerophosphate/cardiolipin synthase-like enzyme
VIVDNKIAIVSSMNFTSGSSGGGSLEAGIVSIDSRVVDDALKYVQRLLEKPDMQEQMPNPVFQTDKSPSMSNAVENRFGQAKPRPERAGKKWSTEEVEELRKGFNEGLTVSQLATKHQRRRGAIRVRLAELGLIDDFFIYRKVRR